MFRKLFDPALPFTMISHHDLGGIDYTAGLYARTYIQEGRVITLVTDFVGGITDVVWYDEVTGETTHTEYENEA